MFLVRAMTDAMDDCDTEEELTQVKKKQIFGIEYEDGNSNVIQASMF